MSTPSVARSDCPIAITGVSAITPLGDQLATVSEALLSGRRALEASADLGGAAQARIADFDAIRYANVRGMRVYNRTTQMAISATKLALDHAKLDTAGPAGETFGL